MRSLAKLPRASGTYKITCVATGKVYVGSAANVYTRCHVHLHQLRNGTHHNAHLQRAWEAYGAAKFSVGLLELVPVADLERREGYWVRHFGSHLPAFGYNIAAVRGTTRGVPRSPEYLKAMSKRKAKRWVLTSPDGVEEVVTNLTKICQARGLNCDMLFRVAYGRARHWQGWKCRPVAMKKVEAETRLPPPRDTRFVPTTWQMIDPTGRGFRVCGLRKFCEANGLHVSAMAEVASGSRKHHKGWTCVKEDGDGSQHDQLGLARTQRGAAVSAGR